MDIKSIGFKRAVDANGIVRYKDAKMPVYSTGKSAGADFFCAERVVIPSIWRIDGRGLAPTLVHTGISIKMGDDEVLNLYNRSGGPKRGLVLANGVGVVDADYYDANGEIMFSFYNFSKDDLVIEVGDKIGQGVLCKFLQAQGAERLNVERSGGFGSTGM